jgi:hypothetical protein
LWPGETGMEMDGTIEMDIDGNQGKRRISRYFRKKIAIINYWHGNCFYTAVTYIFTFLLILLKRP